MLVLMVGDTRGKWHPLTSGRNVEPRWSVRRVFFVCVCARGGLTSLMDTTAFGSARCHAMLCSARIRSRLFFPLGGRCVPTAYSPECGIVEPRGFAPRYLANAGMVAPLHHLDLLWAGGTMSRVFFSGERMSRRLFA